MYLKTYGVKILFCCVCFLFLTGFFWPAAKLQGPDMMQSFDLINTFLFYNGEMAYLEAIKEKCPEMAKEAEKVQLDLELVFGPAYESIKATVIENYKEDRGEDYVFKEFGKNYEFLESYARSEIAGRIIHPISKEGAMNYIDLVKMRIKGQKPIPETLLMYVPEFQNDPAEEFRRGYTKTYRTNDHPKAEGIDFEFKYPASWAISQYTQNEASDTVPKFLRSNNGRGSEIISWMVGNIENEKEFEQIEKTLNKDKLIEYFKKNLMIENTTLYDFQIIKLDNENRYLLIYDDKFDNPKKASRSLEMIATYNNKHVFLKCSAILINESKESLSQKFEKMKPLFELIVNSLVIHGQNT
jgi:hypothetical protein